MECALLLAIAAGAADLARPRPRPETAPPWTSVPVDVARDGRGRLRLLPGVGPARARAILEDRARRGPVERVDELDRVRGIGPRSVEALRAAGAVVVDDAPSGSPARTGR